MSERLILKLGGSVITDKSAGCAVDRTRLASIASTIAGARAGGIIVIHGAGSCGHPEAKRYHLDKGASAGNTEGIFVTHRAVSGLNEAVVAALREKGVPAFGVHPLHTGIADNGRLVGFECRHLEKMLMLGMVPVIHGDVVMDLSRGACIVSGDQLVRYLAVALTISRVGLATDDQAENPVFAAQPLEGQDLLHRHLPSFGRPRRIRRVAPVAPQVAAARAHKDGRHAGQLALALQRMEYF